MSLDSVRSSVEHDLSPIEFGKGFYDAAIGQPLQALRQLAGKKSVDKPPDDASLAASAGGLVGSVVDVVLLSKLTGKVMSPLLGTSERMLASGSRMFVTGSVYGGLLTPSSEQKGLLEGRLENAAVSGTTFAVMGAASKALERNKKPEEVISLQTKILNGAIAGGAGGLVNTFGTVYFQDHRSATVTELAEGAYRYALFGAGFATLDTGGSRALEKVSHSSKYYDYQWKAQRNLESARGQYYSLLNAVDLRHPIQRLGDFVHGTDYSNDGKARPVLTAENNPVNVFEKVLPQYFQNIDAKVESRNNLSNDRAGREEAYRITKEMNGVRAFFAHQLLEVWHGTDERPGMAHHTDVELSTATTPIERVAQIRQALTSRIQQGPFSQLLGKLGNKNIESFGDYEVGSSDMFAAKERFFQYDHRDLGSRMSVPDELAPIVRDGISTPISYLPFDATEDLPNLFHGSSSASLPSVFRERAMIPARELRAKKIEQVSGESRDESMPRRNISITRDFGEALAYSNIDSYYLTGHPIIFGISADVLPRAQYAGLTEPHGEMHIDSKMRVGTSVLNAIGLRKPEVTHLYVPDVEVDSVNQQLQNHRVQGLRVLGFNQLRAPAWKPVPAEAQDWFSHSIW